ncbi:uracil phosphoribosyltransferase [Trichinella spiralis]|uniref:uracil phosphoribosyltransferase n=1 Tax=Trichinella spiralis TaxID=6334 RepID=UPI0001EFCE5D|nr:uracil phosphoribosyltransferase [Trichinella spiralis]
MVQSRVDNSEKCVKMVNTCVLDNFGSKVMFVPMNDQIHELHTIIRDKCTSQGDFVFYSDRLIRLVLEESLNLLPYSPWTVVSPTGFSYDGLRFSSGNCSVSIIRSGMYACVIELVNNCDRSRQFVGGVMEKGLRECCRSMRIGKILIQKDADSGEVKTRSLTLSNHEYGQDGAQSYASVDRQQGEAVQCDIGEFVLHAVQFALFK